MIEFRGFGFQYPEATRPALQDINLTLHQGEVVLLSGRNGSGKSTLLSAMLGIVPNTTGGEVWGDVFFRNQSIQQVRTVTLAGDIGIILQDPESQITNLTVIDEARFGLMNLCLSVSDVIRQADQTLQMLGLAEHKEKSVLTLSGGQMQRLSLASLLAMRPSVLLLDEPVTNLDPLGVSTVIVALERIRPHVDIIVISSHWLDPFLSLADRLIVLNEGHIELDVDAKKLSLHQSQLVAAGVQIPLQVELSERFWNLGVDHFLLNRSWRPQATRLNYRLKSRQLQSETQAPIVLSIENVSFAYPDTADQAVSGFNAVAHQGERIALVGCNGCGKSTLARLMAGLLKPRAGNIIHSGKVGVVLQKPSLGFFNPTVWQELTFGGTDPAEAEYLLEQFGLSDYPEQSPFNLSGGEQRRLALAIAMSRSPDILILDEPTAGLDAPQVENFLRLLKDFTGVVIMITHDSRVVAEQVETVWLMHDQQLVFQGQPAELTSQQMRQLGYDQINAVVGYAIKHIVTGIPMTAHQIELEVADEDVV